MNIEQLNHDFNDITNETALWKVLCERDNYNAKDTNPTTTLKELYKNFEPTVGNSESIWFIKYNLKTLSWEINPKAFGIIEQLKSQNVGFLSTIESSDSTYADEILRSLLGLKGNTFENNEKEPMIYMWSKPFNLKKKHPKRTLIFLRCYGLLDHKFDEFDSSKEHRKMLMKIVLLLSSTVLLCMNLNDKWMKELDDVRNFHYQLIIFNRFLSL